MATFVPDIYSEKYSLTSKMLLKIAHLLAALLLFAALILAAPGMTQAWNTSTAALANISPTGAFTLGAIQTGNVSSTVAAATSTSKWWNPPTDDQEYKDMVATKTVPAPMAHTLGTLPEYSCGAHAVPGPCQLLPSLRWYDPRITCYCSGPVQWGPEVIRPGARLACRNFANATIGYGEEASFTVQRSHLDWNTELFPPVDYIVRNQCNPKDNDGSPYFITEERCLQSMYDINCFCGWAFDRTQGGHKLEDHGMAEKCIEYRMDPQG